MSRSPMVPSESAKNQTGDFDKFTDFARQVFRVPHSQIKAKLEAEKAAKRKIKDSVSRVSGAPFKKN